MGSLRCPLRLLRGARPVRARGHLVDAGDRRPARDVELRLASRPALTGLRLPAVLAVDAALGRAVGDDDLSFHELSVGLGVHRVQTVVHESFLELFANEILAELDLPRAVVAAASHVAAAAHAGQQLHPDKTGRRHASSFKERISPQSLRLGAPIIWLNQIIAHKCINVKLARHPEHRVCFMVYN